MRFVLLCFLTTFLCTGVRAQESFDWQLFRPGEQYLYEFANGSDFVSRYQGMKFQGLEEEQIYEAFKDPGGLNIIVVPSFTGVKLAQEIEVTALYFGTDSLLLRTGAATGESWTASTGIVATVDSITDGVFLSLSDSIKHISFHDEATLEAVGISIQIGKQYGLIRGTNFWDLTENAQFDLVGMNNEAVGIRVPGFEDIMDFKPGTIIHSRSFFRADSVVNLMPFKFRERLAEVISKEWLNEDEVRVTFLSDLLEYRTPFSNGQLFSGPLADSVVIEEVEEVVTFHRDDFSFLDLQPGQIFESEFGMTETRLEIAFGCTETSKGFIDYLMNSNGSYEYVGGTEYSMDSYFVGLGGPYFVFTTEFLYSNVEGIECGTPLDLSGLINGVDNEWGDDRVSLFPNPADQGVLLDIPDDLGQVGVAFYGVSGQLVLRTPVAGGSRSLDVESLPSGVYILIVEGREGPVARRRLVVR